MFINQGTKELQTSRLILRQFELEDAAVMFRSWASNPNVTKYLSWPTHESIEVSESIIQMWVTDYENLEQYNWAIVLKETGEAIGSIGLVNVDNKNERADMGYCIAEEYWGQGMVSEATQALLDFLFKEVGFNRISAWHMKENIASGKVMKKCGMQYEGLARKAEKNNAGEFVDVIRYAILKEDYLK